MHLIKPETRCALPIAGSSKYSEIYSNDGRRVMKAITHSAPKSNTKATINA